jgi:HK97 family phage portal protein
MPESNLILPQSVHELKKSQVSLPPPGGLSRWTVLGDTAQIGDIRLPDKRMQYAEYYEMYRQHPVVRAAIDKKAQYAAAGGFQFVPSAPEIGLNERKSIELNRFFRRSHAKKLLRVTFKDLDIFGESFWYIQRSLAETRTPIRAYRLNPRFMVPQVTNGFLTGWKYGPRSGAPDATDYRLDQILHFSLDDPESEVQGLSPLHSIQRAVAQDIFAMEYNESFFLNSAQTGTVFIVKSTSEDEVKRNRQWLEENYTGPQNAHKPILLEGDVDIESSVAKHQEMEFLRGRMLLRQEIAMVLEVDLEKLGVHEDSNRSVSREVDDAFHSESVWPRQSIIEEEINNVLIQGMYGWSDILFDHNDKDPRRSADQADTDDKNLKSGRETINLQRKRLGLPPIDGGDEAFIMTPTGILFVKNFEKLAKQQLDTGLPVQSNGGVGSTGQAPPKAAGGTKQTRRQAEDTSQKE